MFECLAAAYSFIFRNYFCESEWMCFCMENDTAMKGIFSGQRSRRRKRESFLFGALRVAREQTEGDRPRLRDANTQIPEKTRALWSRIIPITPVTQTDGRQRQNSCLLCHSWDRFIIQAKANFDQQLGTISLKLLGSSVSFCNGVEGGGVLR